MEQNQQQSQTWTERHPNSKFVREFDAPCYRSGWDHDYIPPKKCSEDYGNVETKPSTDIVILGNNENMYSNPSEGVDSGKAADENGEHELEIDQGNEGMTSQAYLTIWDDWLQEQLGNEEHERYEDSSGIVSNQTYTSSTTMATTSTTPDPSWIDQFDQLFYGYHQEEQEREEESGDGRRNYQHVQTQQIEYHHSSQVQPPLPQTQPESDPFCTRYQVEEPGEEPVEYYIPHSSPPFPEHPSEQCYTSEVPTSTPNEYLSTTNHIHPMDSSTIQPNSSTSNYCEPPTYITIPSQIAPPMQDQSLYQGATTDLYNTDQCIHTYNVVNTVEEIHTPEDVLIQQTRLMCIAGEITEYEESYLQQLILSKDPSVKEALRRFSLGESQSLVQLLHACDDNTDLLVRKDKEFAQHIANTPSDERPGTVTHPPTYLGTHYARQLEYNTSYTIDTRGGGGNSAGFEQLYTSLYSNTTNPETTDLPVLTTEEIKHMPNLPPLFTMNNLLCGMVLKRVTSKKIFKKWNRCVFMVKPSFIQLYRNTLDFKVTGAIYWQTNIHSFMHTTDIVRKSYDNVIVYTFSLVENPRTNVHFNAAIQGVSFNPSLPIREVATFGSAYSGIVNILRQKLDEYILLKVTELSEEK